MKVLFIQFSGIQESIGIASLAACLEKEGHESDIILMSHCKNLRAELERYQPDLIGFSVLTGAHKEIMDLARFIKNKTDIPTIIGGPHATYYADEIAEENCVDYICRGEGEEPLVDLVNRLSQGEKPEDIPGIWSRLPDRWVRNECGRLNEDLDSRPMPKREIYYKYGFLRDMTIKRFITGIGCPHPCTFCHSPILLREFVGKGKFMRRKSVQRVIDEVLYVKKLAPLRRIHFSDDTFTLNIEWLREFSQEYSRLAGIPFTCNARLDADPAEIDLLAEAGCVGVQLGFESGSERIRRQYLKKYWSNAQAMNTVLRFKKHGLNTLATNMVALPGETMEEAISTVRWNAKIGFKFVRCNVFMPFPKIDLTDIAKSQGLVKKDYSLKDYNPEALNPVFNQEHANELINLVNLFYIAVKFPLLRNFIIGRLIKLGANRFFDFIGSLNLLQEYFFFGMHPVSAWRYFKNTLGNIAGFRYGAWPATRVYNTR